MMLKDILNKQYVINSDINKEDDSYDLIHLIEHVKDTKYERFLDVLNHIQKRYLYKSKNGNTIHGPNHIERVLFHTNVLAILMDLNDEDYKIVMDGAMYHDSGRINDYEDNFHGFQSACMLNKIMKNDPFYKEKQNLNILKAIVDYHSIDDNRFSSIVEYYGVNDKERCKKLASILKDADALDRVRFLPSDFAYLNIEYLRNEQSVLLVQSAKELINIYRNPVVNNFKKVVEVIEQEEKVKIDLHANDAINIKGCFHGIGFDFFKLDSILKHGILSPTKCRKQDIFTSKNFDLDCNDYIYVVPDSKIDVGGGINSAYTRFIKDGISFYSIVPSLIEGLPISKKEEALERGLPYTRGEYDDELFVKNEIASDAIEYVIVSPENYDKKLNELEYFGCNITPKIVGQKAMYYLNNLKEKLGYEVNPQEIEILIGIYEDIFIANHQTKNSEDLNKKTEYLKEQLNFTIGSYLQDAYTNILKEEATVGKVMEHTVKNRRETHKTIMSDEVMIKVK